LGKFTLAPQIDFDTKGSIDIPLPTDRPVERPQVTVDPHYNPFHTRGAIYPDRQQPIKGWESLYEGLSNNRITPNTPNIDSAPMWQHGRYIFLSTDEGLLLIHSHRAHAAVLYAQFMEQLAHAQGAMQQLLFPEVLSLQPDGMILLEQILPDLRTIGFELEQLSPDSYSIQGVPAQIVNQSPIPVLEDILHQVRTCGASTQEQWRKQIAASLAEQAAIPSGKTLTDSEMRDIVTRLMALPNYRRTADGKTIVSLVTDEELSKRFA
jgi:DNA mismatch repair protein MutL